MEWNNLIEEVRELREGQEDAIRDTIVATIYQRAEEITTRVVTRPQRATGDWDKFIDDVVTSKVFGYPLMLGLLGLVFWLTITGANYPSQLLATLLFGLEDYLSKVIVFLGAPLWLQGLVVQGIYRGLAWVVSVMLPPMAIFFPLFTLLEDSGYLPRIAFNLDSVFKKVGAHGKQALTMAMGFGCNAAGVIAARIIDSPRERLIAIVTNAFVPCNGRFPILISMAVLLVGVGAGTLYGNLLATGLVLGAVLLGIAASLLVSWGLSHTLLTGVPSTFTLELPSYRKPQFIPVMIRSFYDRTLFVLGRAVTVAAPAGAIIWLLANTHFGDMSIIHHLAGFLDPLGRLVGVDGVILLSFVLGLPANEIVIPIMLMTYLSEGAMVELGSLQTMGELLFSHGWTWLTAFNFMIITIMHFPCGTTLLTINKETGSRKWAFISAVIPTFFGLLLCFLLTRIALLFGLV